MTWITLFDIEAECRVAINLDNYPFISEWVHGEDCDPAIETVICRNTHDYSDCIRTGESLDSLMERINNKKGA